MKKTELVHLHALLVQVAEEYISRGVATPEDFEAYRDLEVTPMSLRDSRAAHEQAVRTLAAILADSSERAEATVSDTPRTPS